MNFPNKAHRSRTKQRIDFSEFIDQLILKYENAQNPTIQINSLSLENKVEKRRLYDLLNVFVACNICVKTDFHTYQWKSIHSTNEAVYRISKDLEARAITESIEDTFVLPDSPSIGLITSRFVGVFLFFNISKINIRDVATLMSVDTLHFKPILRRLYLVAYLLERINLFKHSQNIGEYQIDVDVRKTCIKSLEELADADEFPPDSIEYQLNRFDDNYLDTLYNGRRTILADILRRGNKKENLNLTTPMNIAVSNYQGIDI